MRSAIKGGTLMHWQKVMFPSGGAQSTRPGPRPGGSPSLAATCSESRPVTPARPAAELPGGLREGREPRLASARDRSYRRRRQA